MKETRIATFGSGCFWCTEAVFEKIPGVMDVVSGYSGGTVEKPSYRQVSSGKTGHAEVCRITYDPQEVSYAELLDIFWHSHDPTTMDRQGADVGSQYRSVIFYHDEEQRKIAEKSLREMDASGTYPKPIVTAIEAAGPFYPAEDYHQDYFRNNPNAPYCVFVIKPKLDKLDKTLN
ncbi:MAG: peptide-methionine (S)-S-oxide reductase MsrA [Fidelibacterota bacterium]